MAVRVAVGGATGKLGSLVCDLVAEDPDLQLTGAVVSANGGHVGTDVHGVKAVGPDGLDGVLKDCDVYVDLTSPEAAGRAVVKAAAAGCCVVVGTTAVPRDSIDSMKAQISRKGSCGVVSANFAVGVNVFWKLCGDMARMLPGYDIEVIEMHHDRKKDAPSGTAAEAVRRLQAATAIQKVVYGRKGVVGPRQREIGVHSVRAGDIVGDHTVIFAANGEMLELTHRAISREVFARGCIATIKWVAAHRDGRVHGMDEVLGLC
ncbi:MAG: 4-hydroxy-tetrahydrodipicolinate reductase [Methanomethylophilus sp.]